MKHVPSLIALLALPLMLPPLALRAGQTPAGGAAGSRAAAEGAPAEVKPPAPPQEPSPAPAAGSGALPEGLPDGPLVLGHTKPPPEVQKEIERSHASDVKASELRAAARAHPEEIRYQVELMEGLLDLGRVDEALEAGPGLLERFPRSADLFVLLGRALMRDGEFDLAGLQLQRAIALDGSDARRHSLAARVSFIKGDLKSAEAGFRKALTIDPGLQDARSSLSELLQRTGRYEEAISVLTAGKEDAAGALSGSRSRLRGFVKDPPVVLPAGFKSLTLPFVWARGFPPFISMKVAGTIEKFFVIDTASDESLLTQGAARAFGLPDRGAKTVRDEEGKEHLTPVYSVLDSVTIGDVLIKRVPVRVSPGLEYPDDRIAGTLGRDFLRRFRVTIDYPAKTLTLADPDGPPLDGVSFDLPSVILLEGYNGDQAVGKFVLDTSSYTPGVLDARFVADATGLTIFSQEVKRVEGGAYLFSFTMPRLRVGGAEFTKFPATAVDLRSIARQIGVNVRGVIGFSLLKQCRLEIDFKNYKLSLQKLAGPAPPASGTGA